MSKARGMNTYAQVFHCAPRGLPSLHADV